MKHPDIEWFSLETYESVGTFPLKVNNVGDYICPTCGQSCDYWEGQIDQDRMGNDIDGWSFDCFNCMIHSATVEKGRFE